MTGCIDYDDDDDSDGYGYAQYVNLVPQSPDIEFVVEDTSEGDISFAEATDYDYTSTGSYDIEFNQILPNSEVDNFIDDDTLKVKKKKVHSYILYGDTDSPSSYEISIDVSDVFDSDFDDGYAMVQFVNLSNYDDSVDVYILDADASLSNKTADYTLALTDTSGDVELDDGDYKIVFTESGTDTILAMKNDVTIDEGEALSYIFVSYEVAGQDEDSYSIIELNDEGARQLTNEAADSYVRVSNAIANVSSISVAQDSTDNIVSDNLYFGDVSDSFTIDISDSDEAEDVDFYFISDDDDSTLDSLDIDIYADENVLILTSGDAESTITAYDNEEDLRVIDTHAQLLVSHSIDTESSNEITLIIIEQGSNPDSYDESDSISFLSSLTFEVEAGDYDVYVYDADSGDLLLETTVYDVEAGDVINMILTDYETGGAPYQLYTHFN
jgi:hypothetical protein